MVAAANEAPRVLHSLPGRVRVQLSGSRAANGQAAERRLRAVTGVRRAQANALTGNMLVLFDPKQTNEHSILEALEDLDQTDVQPLAAPAPRKIPRRAVHHERAAERRRRVRVPVRSLEFRPGLARRIEERFAEVEGVTVRANHLTGRVLVEYDDRVMDWEDVVATIEEVETLDIPDVDHPAYPLDPAPVIHASTRTAGVALGIGILLGRRLLGRQGPILEQGAATVADAINIMRGIPIVRYGIRRLIGDHQADLLFSGIGLSSLALSNNLQGLILNGVEGFRLLTEVIPRREAWKRYMEVEEEAAGIQPGSNYQPEPGDRIPFPATVVAGTGTAMGTDGEFIELTEGSRVPAGSVVQGGPFSLQLLAPDPFDPLPRPAPLRDTLFRHYLRYAVPVSMGLSAATGVVTRSPAAAFNMLVQTGARTAFIGDETAELGASARVVRSGVVVVGTRTGRTIHVPDTLVIDGARVVANGYELANTFPLTSALMVEEIQAIASRVSSAADSPWGRVFPATPIHLEDEGSFDGSRASAHLNGEHWTLGPAKLDTAQAAAERIEKQGGFPLMLSRDGADRRDVALLVLRPRLRPAVEDLVDHCTRYGIELVVSCEVPSNMAREIASRCGMTIEEGSSALDIIRDRQIRGGRVAVASDHVESAPAFSAADLAIGIIERQPHFPARVDLLAPDLYGVVAILEAGRRRDLATRDSVVLSILSTIGGVALSIGRAPNLRTAANVVYYSGLAAAAVSWIRLRGGARRLASVTQLREPRPERWGRLSVDDALQSTGSSRTGLSSEEAAKRLQPALTQSKRNPMAMAVLEQLRSPLIGIMAAGALLSLSFGAPADVAIIGATIVTNVTIGVWQERKADRASAALAQLSSSECDVLRDNSAQSLPATELVSGDVILLSAGGRIAADARVIESDNLEVSEASITGESLPVFKSANGSHDTDRIVLEGSDVISGSGRAVVVATGRETKMGTLSAAIARREDVENPLNARLMKMLNVSMPIAGTAGLVVMLSGILRQSSLAAPLALGSSVAIAAVPEGLPLLAKMGEAAVGQRLAGKRAVVRRLSAIEALGRVDVACVDKTGTMTTGQLEVRVVDDLAHEFHYPGPLSERGLAVLRTAALASPPPDDANLSVHATDDAVVRAAVLAGINGEIEVTRQEDFPFGSERSYHASRVNGQVCFKGAPEVLLPLCRSALRNSSESTLDEQTRHEMLQRAQAMAERGLRVLAVAQGPGETELSTPSDLVAIGFVGISDPLRHGVPAAVDRCHRAGVRVVMLTGDHPATAQTIAREAGLRVDDHAVLIGSELSTLDDDELDQRMEQTIVVARATPIDKLRIVESLQRLGHTVAMTGDGVNDAPALRLAEAGVAMGRGTEVARQASDIVLLDDDFTTLVEALVEGRGFWQNLRRAVSLLLGGNLGELGLITGVSLLGMGRALNTRQILAVNMISDVLPALAIALQPPRQRRLDRLAREGAASLEGPLRIDIIRRGLATAVPSLLAYVLAARGGVAGDAATVAFSCVVATQFAQTLQAGWSEGSLSKPVVGAIGASTGLLVAALTISPLRTFLGLLPLSPTGFLLVGLASILSAVLTRVPWPEPSQKSATPALRAV